METDERLLSSAAPRLLRLYSFSPPALSYGRSQSPSRWVEEAALARRGWPLVRRPTGGGIVLHLGDITFSVFLPSRTFAGPWDAYARVCAAVGRALASLGAPPDPPAARRGPATRGEGSVCFLDSHARELRVGGRKVAGIAMRWTSATCLCQGSILCTDNSEELAACLLPPRGGNRSSEAERLRAACIPLQRILGAPPPLPDVRRALLAAFVEEFAPGPPGGG